MNEQHNKKIAIFSMIVTFLFVVAIIALVYDAGAFPGKNSRAQILKKYTTALCEDQSIIPGDFYDTNGVRLAYSNRNEDKTIETTYIDNLAYSQLLGYPGRRILDITATNTDAVIEGRDAYRLMSYLGDESWGKAGLYKTANNYSDEGMDVQLTIDHDLQLKVYDLLSNECGGPLGYGSAVVMDAETGAIKAMVSLPTFDVSDVNSMKKQMYEMDKNTGVGTGYPVSYKGAVAPGSTFKVLMAVSLIDHDMKDYTYSASDLNVDGYIIRNSIAAPGEQLTYKEGLKYSNNAFFASAALELGEEDIFETAGKFGLVQHENVEDDYVETDFGYVNYGFPYNVENDVTLAICGYGQGEVELTTVSEAMIFQGLANDGKVMRPYMVESISDKNGKEYYKGKPEKLSQATSKKTCKLMRSALKDTVDYTFDEYGIAQNVRETFNNYNVVGKTGTADVVQISNGVENRLNNQWYASYSNDNDKNYVVIVNHCNVPTGNYGAALMPLTASIYDYIYNEWQK